MTKICILKVDILQISFTSDELAALTIESLMKDLQGWYDQLPAQMHLANLRRVDLSAGVRRSIYHVHLLYLGAVMLLHRRMASYFIRSKGLEKSRDFSWEPFEKMLFKPVEEGILAARHTSRILGLLLEEKAILKQCWLVMSEGLPTLMATLY